MKKPKLHVFEIQWHKRSGVWVLMHEWAIIRSANFKADLVRLAAYNLDAAVELFGQHSELRIRNKNGRYSPARTYPRSADPKRSKG